MTTLRAHLARGLTVVLLVLGGWLALPAPALACVATACGDSGGSSSSSGSDTTESSPTVYQSYSDPGSPPTSSSPARPPVSCSVYANGTGMGSYCIAAGGDGNPASLRERFSGQKLQRCRFSEVPEGIETPFNARPEDGRYMMMRCLENIDLDTFTGGRERILSVTMVFVNNGTDTEDKRNGINDFLWDQFDSSAQMPVPFMRTRPNSIPVVGVPAFFTFRWLDPATSKVVAQGPYADRPDGGPYKQITANGVQMRAQATRITVDPNQRGIDAVTCRPDTPYREGATAAGQPEGACSITFPRSSASARQYATEPIPPNVKSSFNVSVEVTWRVTYGRGADMRELGNGFTMRLKQVLPVQEVQAPNQPPTLVY